MTLRLPIVLALSILVVGAAQAQPTETFKFLSAGDVVALTDKPGTGPKTAHLAEHPAYDVEYALRTDTGNMVEVHAHTTHYIHILEGQGTLTYGGRVIGWTQTAPGEIRGSAIADGTVRAVHAGDYMQIPAGMPHLFNAAAGTKLRYLVFNIKG
jgi:mannose-6-phosphate isomerase-like protein (cupin superfamily)